MRTSDNRLVIGTHGNSIWSTSLTTPVILPVQLTNFSGKIQNGAAKLSWSTASELNSNGFKIERSFDGSSFVSVGFVNALGDGNIVRNYSYLDHGLVSGNNYYRLKIIDKNGDYKYSNVILLTNEVSVHNIYVVNPFNNSIQITLSKMPAKSIAFRLFDCSGRLIGRDEQPANKQYATTFHNKLQSLPSGFYLLEILVDGQAFRKKIVKQ